MFLCLSALYFKLPFHDWCIVRNGQRISEIQGFCSDSKDVLTCLSEGDALLLMLSVCDDTVLTGYDRHIQDRVFTPRNNAVELLNVMQRL